MMSRIQISFEKALHRRARRRANRLGVSLAADVRRLVFQDLAVTRAKPDITGIFDLRSSGGSDIARNKDAMIGAAFSSRLK
jgi:hypothetical protein